MKKAIPLIAVILCSAMLSGVATSQEIIREPDGTEYLAGQIIVKLEPAAALPRDGEANEPRKLASVSEAGPSLRALTKKWGVKESKALFPGIAPPKAVVALAPDAKAASLQKFKKLGNVFVLELPEGTDVKDAVEDFAKDADVEYAEPVYVFRLCMIPNDPLYGQQWYLPAIDTPDAWDINQGSSNPVIAIIDTGVDLDHPDLINQIWVNPVEQPGDANSDGKPGWAGFDDDADGLIDEDSAGRQPGEPGYSNDLVDDDDENGYIDDFKGWNWIDDHNSSQDDHGHGTHCAGIAAAETNNSIGIAGVCPNGKIMPLKAFQSSGSSTSADIALAVEYAYQNGADVISMSFTGPESALVRDALSLAYSTSVLIAAAGNNPYAGPRYPAYYSYVIGVGASTEGGDAASFNNPYNTDVFAPGVNIRSTLLNDTYASWSGTSMATPIVAGIAGFLVSEKTGGFWGPDLYQGQIINASDTSITQFYGNMSITRKRIDAYLVPC